MMDEKYSRIKECESIIFKISNRYSAYYSIDDLYQAGCIGVIKASSKYDINSGVKFTTYAYKYILGEIIDFIRKDKSIIVSDEVYDIYRRYVRIKDLLFDKYQREATFDEICSFMNIDKDYLLRIIEGISFTKSIEEDSFSIDNRDEVDNSIILEKAFESLDDFERSIIDCRYYMGYTQMQTANLLGISQVSVSRNEKLILSKMRENIS